MTRYHGTWDNKRGPLQRKCMKGQNLNYTYLIEGYVGSAIALEDHFITKKLRISNKSLIGQMAATGVQIGA
jgi:hypothetical protein